MSYITKTQPAEHGSVRIIKNNPTKPATQRHLAIHTTFEVSCAFNNSRIKTIKTKNITLKLISKKLRYDMKFWSTIIPAVFETILTNGFECYPFFIATIIHKKQISFNIPKRKHKLSHTVTPLFPLD